MLLFRPLYSIAFREYEKFDHNDYYLIPENTSYLTDILLRNVKINEKWKFF